MNACVESVCPSAVIPPPMAAAVNARPLWEQARDTPGNWMGRRWQGLAAARDAQAPPIVHVHIESFYAAVEQAMNPRLRGKAVLVVAGGLVASASAEARDRGAATGMSIRKARKVCPTAVVIPGDYERYSEYAKRVRQILEVDGTTVEMITCGSFYLDFSGSALLCSVFGTKLRRMQSEILGQTGLSASVGVGTSRLVAALAAREHRLCGLHMIAPGTERAFLGPFPIEKLRAIAPEHISALRQAGLRTIGELQKIPKPALVAAFGAAVGRRIWELARGREIPELHPTGPSAVLEAARIRVLA